MSRITFFFTSLVLLINGCKNEAKVIDNACYVPNGDFEKWDTFTYLIPQNAIESSNPQTLTMSGFLNSCMRVSDSYHGHYAIKLITKKGKRDNCAGYFSNCHLNGQPPTWLGGVPFHHKPSGLKGFYKSSIAEGDSGLIWLNFKKNGKSIGSYTIKFSGIHNKYTPFSLKFFPKLPSCPDTMMFAAVSSNSTDSLAISIPGSSLQLDDITFVDIKEQPKVFDGDFELWEKKTIYVPYYWTFMSGHGEGMARNKYALSGNYALQLTTFLGDDDGRAIASPELVETGKWDEKTKLYRNGFPFTNTIDTLILNYLYRPAQKNDSADISLLFLKDSTIIGNSFLKLGASTNYRTISLPFELSCNPTLANIRLSSSQRVDSAISHVGSTLIIDKIYFKSQANRKDIFNTAHPQSFD
jgi:hypothetical protein